MFPLHQLTAKWICVKCAEKASHPLMSIYCVKILFLVSNILAQMCYNVVEWLLCSCTCFSCLVRGLYMVWGLYIALGSWWGLYPFELLEHVLICVWHMPVCHSLVTGDVLQLEYHQYGWRPSIYHAMQWVHCGTRLRNSICTIMIFLNVTIFYPYLILRFC